MTHTAFRFTLLALAAVSLASCAGRTTKIDNGQYWQRVSASDAIYLQGPKAQQMLNRDISRCVFELRELERLGQIKNAIPTDFHGRVLDPDQKDLYDWDTPERDDQLFAEHGDYQDFESCMLDKGWERVKHVPYSGVERAERAYFANHVDHKAGKAKTEYEEGEKPSKVTSNNQGQFGELND
jgi:hypothetical protein